MMQNKDTTATACEYLNDMPREPADAAAFWQNMSDNTEDKNDKKVWEAYADICNTMSLYPRSND